MWEFTLAWRTAPVSDAALDLDRPNGSTQGGFWVGFTTPDLHQNGTAPLSPVAWTSDRVKRSVSASLAGEVFVMSEGLAESKWTQGSFWSPQFIDTTTRHYADVDPSIYLTNRQSPS